MLPQASPLPKKLFLKNQIETQFQNGSKFHFYDVLIPDHFKLSGFGAAQVNTNCQNCTRVHQHCTSSHHLIWHSLSIDEHSKKCSPMLCKCYSIVSLLRPMAICVQIWHIKLFGQQVYKYKPMTRFATVVNRLAFQ